MKLVNDFLLLLSFLSRLVPGKIVPDGDFKRAVPLMPFAGLVIGAVCIAPFYLGLFSGQPWVQAWLFAILNYIVTRGLHWDGVADLSDAWGSSATGPQFWEILKDSRTGAFGVIGLALGISGQIILVHELMAAQAFGALIFAYMLGRSAVPLAGFFARNLIRDGLGSLHLAGASGKAFVFSLGVVIISGLLFTSPKTLMCALAFMLIILFPLIQLGKREKGFNGDFLGASIVLTEFCVMLAYLV